MAGKAKLVPIATKAAGSQVIRLEEGATVGATIGLNLFMPDGTVVHAEEILNKFAGGKPTLQDLIIWKQLAEVPANVRALAAAAGTGLFAITGPAVGAFRAITEVAGETAVANGDGVAGNPTVGLADVVPAAGGTLQKTQFDTKGRRSHEDVATTDDLAEGVVNLYHTDARVDARIALQKGQPNGLAPLDAGGKIDGAYIPDIAITDTFVVASQAAMLALVAEEGDVAVRTDVNKSFILTAQPATVLANWQELLTPMSPVTSVFGRVGAVVSQTGDYTFAQISGTPTTLAGYGITDAVDTVNAQNISGAKKFLSNITLGDGTGGRTLIIDGAAGNIADVSLRSGGLSRWLFRKNATAESGSNAGSDFELYKFSDAGAASLILDISRATGVFNFSATPTVAGNTVWHAGNDGPGSGLNADQLEGLHGNAGVVGSTVATRDANADLHARLFRPSFANQSNISGAIAFRINNGGDNYIRFCDSPSAVRTWMQTFSGTYTPTLTGLTNVAASSAFASYYTRVGDVVTVSGRINVDPTAAGTTQLLISLPIASTFTVSTQLSGVGSSMADSARILASTATNEALLEYTAASTANTGFTFSFQYLVI